MTLFQWCAMMQVINLIRLYKCNLFVFFFFLSINSSSQDALECCGDSIHVLQRNRQPIRQQCKILRQFRGIATLESPHGRRTSSILQNSAGRLPYPSKWRTQWMNALLRQSAAQVIILCRFFFLLTIVLPALCRRLAK